MAAVTSAVLGAAGLVMGGVKAYDGSKRASNAKNELNSYERESLDNAFKEIKISTLGADLLREENAKTSAGLTYASQLSGARGIMTNIPKIISGTHQINQEAAKLLDDQQMRREYAIAGDNARIEGMLENRDIANIGALSSQIDAGNQDMYEGIMGGLSVAGSINNYSDGFSGKNDTSKTTSFKVNPSILKPLKLKY